MRRYSIYAASLTGVMTFILLAATILSAAAQSVPSTVTRAPTNESHKMVLNTVSIMHDKSGKITGVRNMSQTIKGFDELKKSLEKQTAMDAQKEATGFVFDKATGSIRIEKDLNSTNTAVVEEARRAGSTAGPAAVIIIGCIWAYYPGFSAHSCIIVVL